MPTFHVSVLSQDEIHSLPGTWSTENLRRVLELADADDIGDVPDEDLKEMCLMSLQDLGVQRAGEVVLEAVFAEGMRPGVRQNLVNDLQEDQPWSDFADVSQQRGIFVAVCLLHKAFPTRFGTPDAIRVTVRVQAETDAGFTAIDPQQSAWLVRVLAGGLDRSTFLHRLYEDELKSGAFAEAAGLIWKADAVAQPEDSERSRTLTVFASSQLLGSLDAGRQFRVVV